MRPRPSTRSGRHLGLALFLGAPGTLMHIELQRSHPVSPTLQMLLRCLRPMLLCCPALPRPPVLVSIAATSLRCLLPGRSGHR